MASEFLWGQLGEGAKASRCQAMPRVLYGALALVCCLACGSDSTSHGRLVNDEGRPTSQHDGGVSRDAASAATSSGPAKVLPEAGGAGDVDPSVPPPDGGATGIDSPGCLEVSAPPEAPLRRLSHFEYDNTLRELGDPSEPASRFTTEVPGQTAIDPLQVEQYALAARDFARRVTANQRAIQDFTGCDPEDSNATSCWSDFVQNFISRVFRRPATADDIPEFEAVFLQGSNLGGSMGSGVRAVVEVALQSPEFLYRVEFGEPVDDAAADSNKAGWARPTPYEMASRLSYLLWGSPPDDALLAAAAEGTLRDEDVVASEARRMLEDERARAVVRRFYFDHLGISQRRPSVSLEPDIASLAVAETERFIDAVTWEEPGTFAALLTAPFTFLNAPLAAHYGVTGVSGEDFVRVELGATYGAGILTHASYLAAPSPTERTSPTQRGMRVHARLLCRPPRVPPAEVTFPASPASGNTTRERLIAFTREPDCAECHDEVDPLGFAFEHYDWTGRFRETEDGYPIDATGAVEIDGAVVRFVGPKELGAVLAASAEVHQCYVQSWLRFALGRSLTDADTCSQQQLEDTFAASDGNVRELLVGLTRTDSFRYRPTLPESP